MNEKDRYIKIWEKRFKKQEEYMEQVRALKHDMEAHIIVLQYYLNEGLYEDAEQYLHKLRNIPMPEVESVKLETGNKLVDVLIEEYLSRDLEIFFVCEGVIPNKIEISSYDLCVIFSNIITNAVEACEKLCKLEKKIHMRLRTEKDSFIIEVENPIEWEVEKVQSVYKSTKTDVINHGYGMKNIEEVIKKYKGNIDFEIEKNLFVIKIELAFRNE